MAAAQSGALRVHRRGNYVCTNFDKTYPSEHTVTNDDLCDWLKGKGVKYRLGAGRSNPGTTGQTQIKREPMLERLANKYPKLKGAISTNDPAFLGCRVPREHAPGNKQGYYYFEMVEAACAERWSPETPAAAVPPSGEKLGNF